MQNYIKEIIGICGLPYNEITSEYKILQIGSKAIYVSNYKKIISYGDNCISLKVKSGAIRIDGEDLKIKQMDKGEIIISGRIYGVWDGAYGEK